MNWMLVHFMYKHITGEEDNLSSSPVICLYQKFRTPPDFCDIHKLLMFTPAAKEEINGNIEIQLISDELGFYNH